MKKFIYLFIYSLLIQSCKSQVIISDLERKNIIVFDFIRNDSRLIGEKSIYSKDELIINSSIWSGEDMGVGNFKREYYFVKNKDTMSMICGSCGKAGNYYYFKNIEFQKGNYEFKIENRKNRILGKQIKTSREVQNILFRNAYPWWKKNDDFKDMYFKDLQFFQFDIKDTINVKLKKLN
ncbi:hypothetical protein SL053_002336 [Flavobacterium psychrophilum]|nr:hypothetical protein [Flavobacterium psychrophilum]